MRVAHASFTPDPVNRLLGVLEREIVQGSTFDISCTCFLHGTWTLVDYEMRWPSVHAWLVAQINLLMRQFAGLCDRTGLKNNLDAVGM